MLLCVESFSVHWYLFLKTGSQPHLHILVLAVPRMYMLFLSHSGGNSNGCIVLYPWMICGLTTWACYWWYGKLPACSNSTLQKTYFLWGGLFLCKMVTILHLEGLNLPMILPRFKPAYSVGQIREGHKPYHLRQCRKVGHRPQKTWLMIARVW